MHAPATPNAAPAADYIPLGGATQTTSPSPWQTRQSYAHTAAAATAHHHPYRPAVHDSGGGGGPHRTKRKRENSNQTLPAAVSSSTSTDPNTRSEAPSATTAPPPSSDVRIPRLDGLPPAVRTPSSATVDSVSDHTGRGNHHQQQHHRAVHHHHHHQNLPPWVKNASSDPPYREGVMGLHDEIEDYFEWMLPTPAEHSARVGVVRRISDAIQSLWRGCGVEIFGSFGTGLYLPTSDIDLVVHGSWDMAPLNSVRDELVKRNIVDEKAIKVLSKAAVPIVKLTDLQSDIKVDISFNMATGLRAVELIKHFKKKYPSMAKLIYVLKQFLLQRDLNEVFTGGLSSYALILLVVSFLQLHPRPHAACLPNGNVGVLLLELLEYYTRNFNYKENAIRINDGGSVIPKVVLQRQMSGGATPNLISIEDPHDPQNDVGKSSYGAYGVKTALDQAYVELRDLVLGIRPMTHGTLLSHILQVEGPTLSWRRDIASRCPFPAQDDHTGYPPPPSRQPRTRSEDTDVNRYVSMTERALLLQQPAKDSNAVREASEEGEVEIVVKEVVSKPEEDNSSDCISLSSGDGSGVISNNSSDTDSDLSPHSAMSVSPASSEVGSIGSLKSQHSGVSNSGKRNLASPGAKSTSSSSSGSKKHYWPKGKDGSSAAPGGGDRADLDLNWRASKKAGKGTVTAATNGSTAQKPGSESSADTDPNWRLSGSSDAATNGITTISGNGSTRDFESNWRKQKGNSSSSGSSNNNATAASVAASNGNNSSSSKPSSPVANGSSNNAWKSAGSRKGNKAKQRAQQQQQQKANKAAESTTTTKSTSTRIISDLDNAKPKQPLTTSLANSARLSGGESCGSRDSLDQENNRSNAAATSENSNSSSKCTTPVPNRSASKKKKYSKRKNRRSGGSTNGEQGSANGSSQQHYGNGGRFSSVSGQCQPNR